MARYNKKQIIEGTLRELYEKQKKTQREIAIILGISVRSIRRWMAIYGIKGRLYIGKDNVSWKHGQRIGDYRCHKNKKMEICEICRRMENLGIHHKDLDHYNNDPENLQVLCVSCHMRLHGKMHWEAIKQGKIPLMANGRIGWNPKIFHKSGGLPQATEVHGEESG